MSDGDRFGREEGMEATVFDFGWRNEPIWEEVKITILIKNLPRFIHQINEEVKGRVTWFPRGEVTKSMSMVCSWKRKAYTSLYTLRASY